MESAGLVSPANLREIPEKRTTQAFAQLKLNAPSTFGSVADVAFPAAFHPWA